MCVSAGALDTHPYFRRHNHRPDLISCADWNASRRQELYGLVGLIEQGSHLGSRDQHPRREEARMRQTLTSFHES